MEGHHGYLRRDARKALARGLAGKLPASWKPAEENAAVEVWLTIDGATAVCGLRLSDRTMRHRTYKLEHRPASLRPTLAAAMVRLAEIKPPHVVLDPMCGAGTLLAEHLASMQTVRVPVPAALGGDIDAGAVRAAAANLRRLGAVHLGAGTRRSCRWPTRRWTASCPTRRSASSSAKPEEIGPLYRRIFREYDRVLRPGGRAVLLTADAAKLRPAAQAVGWKSLRQLTARILGQAADDRSLAEGQAIEIRWPKSILSDARRVGAE